MTGSEPPLDVLQPVPAGDGQQGGTFDTVIDLDAAWAELMALADAPDGTDEDGRDEDRESRLVAALHRDGDPRVLDLAVPLLTDPAPGRRRMAAWVLGQLGYGEGRPFEDVIAPALATAARSAVDDQGREDFVWALGFAGGPRWAAELSRYAADPFPPIRLAVARRLVSMFDDTLDDDAVSVLIGLTTDDDPDVRDWAVFSLGTLTDHDTPALRDAFVARLDDDGGNTKFEATLGLARRGDGRVLERLLARLDVEDDIDALRLDLESAAELGDPMLLPVLEKLCRRWAEDEDSTFLDLARMAKERCDPAGAARAAVLEEQLVSAVNARLSDAGWTVESSGGYPRTLLRFRGPDGAVIEHPFCSEIWDGVTVASFDLDREVERCVHVVHSAVHGVED